MVKPRKLIAAGTMFCLISFALIGSKYISRATLVNIDGVPARDIEQMKSLLQTQRGLIIQDSLVGFHRLDSEFVKGIKFVRRSPMMASNDINSPFEDYVVAYVIGNKGPDDRFNFAFHKEVEHWTVHDLQIEMHY